MELRYEQYYSEEIDLYFMRIYEAQHRKCRFEAIGQSAIIISHVISSKIYPGITYYNIEVRSVS